MTIIAACNLKGIRFFFFENPKSINDNVLRSPNNSFRADGSPRTNSTLRPRPPPYKPPNSTYKNGLTI